MCRAGARGWGFAATLNFRKQPDVFLTPSSQAECGGNPYEKSRATAGPQLRRGGSAGGYVAGFAGSKPTNVGGTFADEGWGAG